MDIYPGRIVKSIAGRDKDNYFVVLSVEDNVCYVSDGKIRKVDTPKKKKVKHLIVTEFFCEVIAEKLKSDQTVTDSMIRKELKSLNLM